MSSLFPLIFALIVLVVWSANASDVQQVHYATGITLDDVVTDGSSMTFGSSSDSCQIVPHSCDFYRTCLESMYPCGNNGYAVGYGYHYCSAYLKEYNSFSAKAKLWIDQVLVCLQQVIVTSIVDDSSKMPNNEADRCKFIKQVAFDSHPKCYVDVEPSFCDALSPKDLIKVVLITGKDSIFSADGLKQALATFKTCVERKLHILKLQELVLKVSLADGTSQHGQLVLGADDHSAPALVTSHAYHHDELSSNLLANITSYVRTVAHDLGVANAGSSLLRAFDVQKKQNAQGEYEVKIAVLLDDDAEDESNDTTAWFVDKLIANITANPHLFTASGGSDSGIAVKSFTRHNSPDIVDIQQILPP